MSNLTTDGRERLRVIAERHGVSVEAAESLFGSLQRGNGAMAQFNHPELGGYGQWMRGGMTMVSDMFNNALKAKVDGLCADLSSLLDSNPFVPVPMPSPTTARFPEQQQSQGGGFQQQGGGSFQQQGGYGGWWPSELGSPSTSGAQNDLRYAYFGGPRRLVIEQNGIVTVYDTQDHQIGGVSQQQGGGQSLAFTSQLGTVDLPHLPVVSTNAPSRVTESTLAPSTKVPHASHSHAASSNASALSASSHSSDDIFAMIEKLAALKDKGILTEEEFSKKKAELLARL